MTYRMLRRGIPWWMRRGDPLTVSLFAQLRLEGYLTASLQPQLYLHQNITDNGMVSCMLLDLSPELDRHAHLCACMLASHSRNPHTHTCPCSHVLVAPVSMRLFHCPRHHSISTML